MIIGRCLVESVRKNNAERAFKGWAKNRRGIFARPCKGSPFCPAFLAKQKSRSPVGRDRRTLKQSINPKQTHKVKKHCCQPFSLKIKKKLVRKHFDIFLSLNEFIYFHHVFL
jgi:hypothetical protein